MVRGIKFGGGETLMSLYDVTFTAIIQNQVLELTASVVPGNTPFLLARPTLEAWKVKQDRASGNKMEPTNPNANTFKKLRMSK